MREEKKRIGSVPCIEEERETERDRRLSVEKARDLFDHTETQLSTHEIDINGTHDCMLSAVQQYVTQTGCPFVQLRILQHNHSRYSEALHEAWRRRVGSPRPAFSTGIYSLTLPLSRASTDRCDSRAPASRAGFALGLLQLEMVFLGISSGSLQGF
jgi:hypothetical protein